MTFRRSRFVSTFLLLALFSGTACSGRPKRVGTDARTNTSPAVSDAKKPKTTAPPEESSESNPPVESEVPSENPDAPFVAIPPEELTAQELESEREVFVQALDANDGAKNVLEIVESNAEGAATSRVARGSEIMIPALPSETLPELGISVENLGAVLEAGLVLTPKPEDRSEANRKTVVETLRSALEKRKKAAVRMLAVLDSEAVNSRLAIELIEKEKERLERIISLLNPSDESETTKVMLKWQKSNAEAPTVVDPETGMVAYLTSAEKCITNPSECGEWIANQLEKAIDAGQGNYFKTALIVVVSTSRIFGNENIATAMKVSEAYLVALAATEKKNLPILGGEVPTCLAYLTLDPETESRKEIWNDAFNRCKADLVRIYGHMHAVTNNAVNWTRSRLSQSVVEGNQYYPTFMCRDCKTVAAKNQEIVNAADALDKKIDLLLDRSFLRLFEHRAKYYRRSTE